MREILDRNADRLSPEERRAIWEKIAGTRGQEAQARMRWPLPVTAATAAVVVAAFLFTVQQREPADLRRSAPRGERVSADASRPGTEVGSEGATQPPASNHGAPSGHEARRVGTRVEHEAQPGPVRAATGPEGAIRVTPNPNCSSRACLRALRFHP